VATSGGIVRPADWLDPALLDLSACAGSRIAVADVERDDWDGRALASSLSDTEWARSTGTTFVAVPVALMYAGHERRIAPADFAAFHDEPARAERLARKCSAAAVGYDAVLLGPWLGVEPGTLELVRRAAQVMLGEATSPPGAAAGARFEKARARLLAQMSVECREESVVRVGPLDDARHEIGTEAGTSGAFDAVVLASGGFVGGGVSLVSSGALGGAFRLSCEAPVRLGFDGEVIEHASAAYGFDPVTARGAWIERVGVLATSDGLVAPGIHAAGDVLADRPRTVLSAALSGLAAAVSLLTN
jgi:anaerobic glycerol-3-phosphate dehydrogenase